MNIYENITNAPFFIGAKVQVSKVVDEEENKGFVGMIGKIRYYEYDCGCGQTYPTDPMIGVMFYNGEVEEFWKEELALI